MIDEAQLQDSADFVNAAREPGIGAGRGRVTRWVIVHQDEEVGRMLDDRLKNSLG